MGKLEFGCYSRKEMVVFGEGMDENIGEKEGVGIVWRIVEDVEMSCVKKL